MAADYTQWPLPADVLERLDTVGVTLRPTGTALTDRLNTAIDQVTDEIAQRTQRQFVADASDTSRLYDGTGTPEQEIDEIVSLTSAAVVGLQAAPGYTLTNAVVIQELNKPQTRLLVSQGSAPALTSEGILVPYPAIFPAGRRNIQITGRFGYGAAIPKDLWNAVCSEIALRIGQESLFSATGRLTEWREGDESEQYALTEMEATLWHDWYERCVRRYARPSGRRLRVLKCRMA